jgi:hypothetical protein
MLEKHMNPPSGPQLTSVSHASEVVTSPLHGYSCTSQSLLDCSLETASFGVPKAKDSSSSEEELLENRPRNVSLVELLLSKKVVDLCALNKIGENLPKVLPSERLSVEKSVALVNNSNGVIHVAGFRPKVVLLDTGAQPVILGIAFATKIGVLHSNLQKLRWQIRTASGSIEEVLGETLTLLTLSFNSGTEEELLFQVRCLVTNASSYDILIGQEALFPPGFTIDNWLEHAYYRVDWEADGLHLGYIPLDLHGDYTPAAHHCVLKEANTILYILSSLQEWIEEDVEEIANAQAPASLIAALIEIVHGP